MGYAISPLSDLMGAEITGLDLGSSLDAEDQHSLNAALAEYSLLVMRDQNLSATQLLAASRLFGEMYPQKHQSLPGFKPLEDCPEVHQISNEDKAPNGRRVIPGSGWHTDHSNAKRPPKAIMLYAIQLPDTGGDTQFVNLNAAYEALSADTKDKIEKLVAVHTFRNARNGRHFTKLDAYGQPFVPGIRHPLVRTHPENGRKAIYINPPRIAFFEGLDDESSDVILTQLFHHATQVEFQYRHKWIPGDLVIWDNRCLIHKANGDYDMNQTRKLYRIMIQGDVPF